MDTNEYESTHANFVKQLADSQTAVDVMAMWFRLRGDQVHKPEYTVAPTRSDAPDHADSGDLYVNGERTEIRHQGLDFTCAGDWPYPCFYVESVHALDKKNPQPVRYYYVNPPITHAAVLDIEKARSDPNPPGWRKGTFWHKTDRKQANVYVCNMSAVEWIKL